MLCTSLHAWNLEALEISPTAAAGRGGGAADRAADCAAAAAHSRPQRRVLERTKKTNVHAYDTSVNGGSNTPAAIQAVR